MIDAIKRLFGKETTEVAPVQEASVDQEVMGMEAPRKRKGKGKKRAYTRKQKLTASVAPGKVVHATDATFQRLANVPGTPVLVDFWAEWCAPCRALGPTIDGLADDYAGRVKVGKLNLDEHQAIAQQYQISQIPTLLVFKGGELAERLIGLKPKHEFQQVLDGLLQ